MQETATLYDDLKLTEVFTTNAGGIYQSDSESCWYVNFAGKLNRFDYRCLLKLKKSVYNIDVDAILLKSGKSADIEIVFICACDHSYVLTVLEIIALRELIQGAFAMLELNHIIYDRLYRLAV